MDINDVYFRTGLHSPTRDFDADTTEFALRIAQHIAEEHSDGLGLDDYDVCDAVTDDLGTYGGDDGSLYVDLGDDAIRERAAAVAHAKGGAA